MSSARSTACTTYSDFSFRRCSMRTPCGRSSPASPCGFRVDEVWSRDKRRPRVQTTCRRSWGSWGIFIKYRSKGVKKKMLVSGLFLLGGEVWEEHSGYLYLWDGQITLETKHNQVVTKSLSQKYTMKR